MFVRDVPTGFPFSFVGRESSVYISRGSGWYGSPIGYDGGPWTDDTSNVVRVPTNLHPFSFLGIDNVDLLRMYQEFRDNPAALPGLIAMAQVAIADRGLIVFPVTGRIRPMTVSEYLESPLFRVGAGA